VSSSGPAWQNGSVSVKKKQSSKRSKGKKQARRVVALKGGSSPRKEGDIFGFMSGRMEIVGDMESPSEDWKYWDSAKNQEK
jgi:hypothetical protein